MIPHSVNISCRTAPGGSICKADYGDARVIAKRWVVSGVDFVIPPIWVKAVNLLILGKIPPFWFTVQLQTLRNFDQLYFSGLLVTENSENVGFFLTPADLDEIGSLTSTNGMNLIWM